MKHASWFAVSVSLAALCPIVQAQTPPPSLVACTRMSDPAERLHCYDAQMTAMGAVVASPPPAAPGAVASATPPPTPEAKFGVEDIKKSKRPAPAAAPAPDTVVASVASPPPAAVAPQASAEAKFGADDLKQSKRPKESLEDKVLLSTITSIKEVRPKLFIIVLANGQIWMQEGTQITSFFKAGFDARIEKGLLGDYRMATAQTGEKNMVRVTRIQ
jgi:hypothetical protein